MFRVVPKELKEEILAKVKAGEKVLGLANQYGISNRTIYGWLSHSVIPQISFGEYNRVRRENEELKRLIGVITLDLELEKKRKVSFGIKK